MAEEGSKPKGLPVVLVVDDEPLLLEAIRLELEGVCELHTAEADKSVSERRYDVIVCDHMLPGEQGLEFLGRMVEMFPSTKRILMTGYTNPEFISRSSVIAGLSKCLVKPLRPTEVARAIKDALAS